MTETKTSQRIALGIEYNGKSWSGWQSQPSGHTVQDALQASLSEIAGHPISVTCAGRTDAGVHATHQVVHLDTVASRPISAWVRGANSLLPDSIAVRWSQAVADDFHARFSARGRRYQYFLLCRPQRPGLMSGRVGWQHRPLDIVAMQTAAKLLLGTHDFSAFRAAQCQAKSPIKTLMLADIRQYGELIVFDFAADAFLHHMIRNLVGSLVYVGLGRTSLEGFAHILAQANRKLAAPTYSPDGLYFLGPAYEQHWQLPGLTEATLLGDNPTFAPPFVLA